MVISKTPLRISFFGGGTDLPSFYESSGYGAVLSTSIDSYIYTTVKKHADIFLEKYRLNYSETEQTNDVNQIKNPIIRECIKYLDITDSIYISTIADLPGSSGLGSSSSFCVGLLMALYRYKGEDVSTGRLARDAAHIEIDLLKRPIGKQDHYAAAFGGLNYFRFNDDESVEVRPIELSEDQKRFLETTLSLHFVGGSRQASNILGRVKQALDQGDEFASLILIRQQADELLGFFKNHEKPNIGSTLSEGWRLKKRLTYGVSNTQIERILSIAEEKGMMGGKLLGAGGNGFLLLQHEDSKSLISTLGSRHIPFQFDNSGTEVLFNDHQ